MHEHSRPFLYGMLAAVCCVVPSCLCPSSFQEVPAPGAVLSLGDVDALSHCQIRYYGTTLLGKAPNAEVVNALVDKGADVHGKLILNGKECAGSPLSLAKNASVIGALLVAGADPNIAGGEKNESPLHLALERADIQSVNTLVEAGADPNRPNSQGETPLCVAAARLDAEMCRLLIRNGAGVDMPRRSDGATPLLVALKQGGVDSDAAKKVAVAKVLMEAGCNYLAEDSVGNLPIHVAPTALIPALLASGANVNSRNAHGRTPLFFGGSRERIDLLISNGAELNARDFSGNTAFDVVTDASLKSYLLVRGCHSGQAL